MFLVEGKATARTLVFGNLTRRPSGVVKCKARR